jgi:hypothetical protein
MSDLRHKTIEELTYIRDSNRERERRLLATAEGYAHTIDRLQKEMDEAQKTLIFLRQKAHNCDQRAAWANNYIVAKQVGCTVTAATFGNT